MARLSISIAATVALLMGAAGAAAAPTPAYEQRAAERYIIQSEAQWADSLATGKTSDVERILADDFRGVDPDGTMSDRAAMLAGTRVSPPAFISNRIGPVTVRFYGDAAVAQGSETWERRSGEPRKGRFVWTDTWIRRDGVWKIVASEDLIPPEPGR